MSVRRSRYCGFSPDNDPLHYVLPATSRGNLARQAEQDGRTPAPRFVKLKDGKHVVQWAPTVRAKVTGFDPAGDCKGNFMSYRFQPNNNCYKLRLQHRDQLVCTPLVGDTPSLIWPQTVAPNCRKCYRGSEGGWSDPGGSRCNDAPDRVGLS